MIEQTIQNWHAVLASRDLSGLEELLAEDVTFHSPIVHTPQQGKQITTMYLTGAFTVLTAGEFRYVREVMSGDNAVLEFEAEVDGIYVNGVDLIRCNDRGEIVDFKVMVRPLKAVNLLHQKMAEMLQALAAR